MVCINFLAMPTLKKVRSCFLRPISIMPLRELNETLESARMGISKPGSRERWAAWMTTSAMPTSLVSTLEAAFFRFFLAARSVWVSVARPAVFRVVLVLAMGSSALLHALLRVLLRGAGRLAPGFRDSLRVTRNRRSFGRCGRLHCGPCDTDVALDPLLGHDDRGGHPLGPRAGPAEQLVGLQATRLRRRDLLELRLQLLGRELAALQPI